MLQCNHRNRKAHLKTTRTVRKKLNIECGIIESQEGERMKIFLSGSKTATALPEKLTALLDAYCQQNCEFLIGDCRGADRLMQEYLSAKGYQNVTVYVSGAHTRHCIAGYPVRQINVPESIAGFEFYRQKDIAMAKNPLL